MIEVRIYCEVTQLSKVHPSETASAIHCFFPIHLGLMVMDTFIGDDCDISFVIFSLFQLEPTPSLHLGIYKFGVIAIISM